MKGVASGSAGLRSRLLPLLFGGAASLSLGAATPPQAAAPFQSIRLADVTIQIPIGFPYPVIVKPDSRRDSERRDVAVQFIAQGNDWASIYLDDRLLFRANNTRRNHRVEIEPGAYRLTITGVTRFDVWASGYLDVGREGSNLIVIRYGKGQGVRVSGDPYAWIPDE